MIQAAEIVGAVLPQIIVTVLSAIAAGLYGRMKGAAKEREEARRKNDRERDDVRAILRLLLYYRLRDLFEEYVVQEGDISSSDKHEIEEVYTFYHELGGNGEGTRMYRELIALKTM